MTRPSGPVETKVAAAGLAAFLVSGTVSIVFAFAAVYHWFTPPPAYLIAALSSLLVPGVTALAGWLAPHTSRPAVTPPAKPPVNPLGEAILKSTIASRARMAEALAPRGPAIGDLRAGPGPGHPAEIFTGPGWEPYQPEPAVQPEATTSGPAGKVTP